MNKRAVCIGINTYPLANDLNGCINDAMGWADVLVNTFGFARSDVQVMTDASATKRRMLDALDTLMVGATKGDVLVYTYSGHGTYVGDTDGDEPQYDEAMCPYDLEDGLLLDDELRAHLQALPPGVHLTVISDSCFSGTVTRVLLGDILPGMLTRDQARRRVRFLSPSLEWMPQRGAQVLDNPWTARPRALTQATMNHLLISGCTDHQYSYDAAFGNQFYGAMSYACQQVIKASDARLTYRQLVSRVNTQLKAWGFPQNPQLEGKPSDKRRRLFS